jgi:4-hydroxy-tetrahydrodipicolinate reductase
VAKGRGVRLSEKAAHDRSGQREIGDIGFAVLRGGDVVGDHTVFFAGPGERIELSHRASSRVIYAHGAVHAALWIADKPAGLYTMQDVLNLGL